MSFHDSLPHSAPKTNPARRHLSGWRRAESVEQPRFESPALKGNHELRVAAHKKQRIRKRATTDMKRMKKLGRQIRSAFAATSPVAVVAAVAVAAVVLLGLGFASVQFAPHVASAAQSLTHSVDASMAMHPMGCGNARARATSVLRSSNSIRALPFSLALLVRFERRLRLLAPESEALQKPWKKHILAIVHPLDPAFLARQRSRKFSFLHMFALRWSRSEVLDFRLQAALVARMRSVPGGRTKTIRNILILLLSPSPSL